MFFCISFLSYCHTGKLNNRTVNDFSQIYVSYIADILPIVNHWQDISSSLSPSCILIRSVLSTYILEFRANWNALLSGFTNLPLLYSFLFFPHGIRFQCARIYLLKHYCFIFPTRSLYQFILPYNFYQIDNLLFIILFIGVKNYYLNIFV